MCQPITHYLVAKKALENYPNLAQHEAYAALGSFGPDQFYLVSNSSHLSDAMHGSNSLDAFCIMMDEVFQMYQYDSERANRMAAYTLGFYAHVIADCVFHPYVYRSSNDHWSQKDTLYETKHKEIEAVIDQIILEERSGGYLPPPAIQSCYDEAGLLHPDIAYTAHKAFATAYPNDIALAIAPFDASSPEHPIQIAFNNYSSVVSHLYGVHNVMYKAERFLAGALPDKVETFLLNQERERHNRCEIWPPEGLTMPFSYSATQMFDMAVRGVQAVVEASIAFIESGTSSSRVFFQQYGSYLGENWNLDTGLPSSCNFENEITQDNLDRFTYGLETLQRQYNQLSQG